MRKLIQRMAHHKPEDRPSASGVELMVLLCLLVLLLVDDKY